MRRTITLCLGFVLAVIALVLIVLVLPPVQRRLVLAALDTPGMSRSEVGGVQIRPGSATIEDLLIEKGGMRLAFDRAVVRGTLWRAVLGRDVHLLDYELDGLLLSIDAGETGERKLGDTLIDAAFILAPFAFELDQVALNGSFEVRLDSDRSLIASLIGRGGRFGAAQTGQLELKGEVIGEGLLAEPVPYALSIDVWTGGDFRRIETSLNGVLGGDVTLAEFSSAFVHENAVSEAEGALAVDIRRIDELFAGTEGGRFSSGQGELTFKWAANSSGESVTDGLIVAKELVSSGTGYRIDEIMAPFRVAVAPGFSLSLKAPVEVRRGTFASDLLVELTAVADQPYWRLNGTWSGDQIRVDDLASLGVFFALPTDPLDALPAWGGLRGQLGLEFERVEIGSGIAMESFTAEIEFADGHVGIRSFDSAIGGGTFTGEADLEFDPGLDESYDLDGAWKGRGIQLERLGSFATNSAPIEGRFDLDLSVKAKASDLRLIADGMSGVARIHGGPGVCRGLGDYARSASSMAGILGSLFGSENLRTVSELADELAEINYDTFEMEATQSAGEGLEVGRMFLQGPAVKLYGRGRVAGMRPAELMMSPMQLDFNLGAKGRLADLLDLLGLVSENRRDWEGYAFMSEPFSVRGTPENPDISELWGLLRTAVVNAFR
jgi:hypothetical protein